MMKHRELLLHASIAAVPAVIFCILTIIWIEPFGERVLTVGTTERSPFVDRLLPDERAMQSDEGDWLTIVDEPVYFSVHPPAGSFERVEVTLEYRPRGVPIVELGGLVDLFSQHYDLHPLENALIDASDWTRLQDGEYLLLSRDGSRPSDTGQLATYHANWAEPYREGDYVASSAWQYVDAPLRGSHGIVTYIKNEDLAFSFAYIDRNEVEGDDAGAIRVRNEAGEVVAEVVVADNATATEVTAAGLPEGVYTLELAVTSDIEWQRIGTAQKYLVFSQKIDSRSGNALTGLRRYPVTEVVTGADRVVVETYSAESPESILVNDEEVAVPLTNEKIAVDLRQRGLSTIAFAGGDIKLTGDGLFAFAAVSYFDPYPQRLSATTDLDAAAIRYILADYRSPIILDEDWRRASAQFDLAPLRQADGSLKLVVSVPEIQRFAGTVDVRSITLRFTKPPMSLGDIVRKLIPGL